eukprot:c15513_g1_i2.p1 GENE.c15513_g1_i2~~c15513_g1_i2.p1  ORF type:complete len:214 (+),score=11.89 c15513_g1_i2:83-724(+)
MKTILTLFCFLIPIFSTPKLIMEKDLIKHLQDDIERMLELGDTGSEVEQSKGTSVQVQPISVSQKGSSGAQIEAPDGSIIEVINEPVYEKRIYREDRKEVGSAQSQHIKPIIIPEQLVNIQGYFGTDKVDFDRNVFKGDASLEWIKPEPDDPESVHVYVFTKYVVITTEADPKVFKEDFLFKSASKTETQVTLTTSESTTYIFVGEKLKELFP